MKYYEGWYIAILKEQKQSTLHKSPNWKKWDLDPASEYTELNRKKVFPEILETAHKGQHSPKHHSEVSHSHFPSDMEMGHGFFS